MADSLHERTFTSARGREHSTIASYARRAEWCCVQIWLQHAKAVAVWYVQYVNGREGLSFFTFMSFCVSPNNQVHIM